MRWAADRDAVQDVVTHDVAFHRVIVEAFGNQTLLEVWTSPRDALAARLPDDALSPRGGRGPWFWFPVPQGTGPHRSVGRSGKFAG
jgi:DNA-binding FadR family transcriptional regulator